MYIFQRILLVILFLIGSVTALHAQQFLLQEGMQNYQQGNFEKSIDLLEQAIQRDSLQLDAYVLLGASYLKEEVPEVAQLKAEQGLQHFPNAGSLSWIRAEALFQQQQFTTALSIYSKLYEEHHNKQLPAAFTNK
ncbi:tetratricopeptide repeat protein [Fodinibius sp.]|uniref:tetratricopeptide repeat protein n=1 Tax=Fodinibius sp. TaxID=1872440 RepID=UPI002ACD20EB|nr:tetratricopeptide repeat protein [Fodinibius sp.]MDZ7659250.1 hypothetical protein [Fodinibius sp.]